jgi:hypothetical protein
MQQGKHAQNTFIQSSWCFVQYVVQIRFSSSFFVADDLCARCKCKSVGVCSSLNEARQVTGTPMGSGTWGRTSDRCYPTTCRGMMRGTSYSDKRRIAYREGGC